MTCVQECMSYTAHIRLVIRVHKCGVRRTSEGALT
jgi:hypothetical protein